MLEDQLTRPPETLNAETKGDMHRGRLRAIDAHAYADGLIGAQP
jgi:hypothetical protein